MDRPNILIIQADQHRYDCLGAYGNPDVQTPNIDQLAMDGVRYDNSFCPYPVCTPSRYSFLSSLYVRQHLAVSNHATLPAGLPTFPRVLRAQGYSTAAVGKMHFTPTYADVGFERMWLAEQNGPGRYDDDYHAWLQDQGQVDMVDLLDQEREFRTQAPPDYWDSFGALESDLSLEHHSTTWIGERAMEALGEWAPDESNLLMVSFIKPHHPFDPPAPYSTMYDPHALTLLPGWTEHCLPRDLAYRPGYFDYEPLSEARLRQVMACYYGTITQIDDQVGRMLELLRARNLYENTIVIYNSDHGEYLGFHHLLLKGNYMYDPLIKVPLIVKYPAGLYAGQSSDRLVNSTDIGPTLLRLAGADVPDTFAGIDLLDNRRSRTEIVAEAGRGDEYMIRSQRYKLLLCRNPDQSQFFDLDADPLEMENRIDDPAQQTRIAEMRERLLAWALFDATPPVHVDEAASVIQNAPSGRRDQSSAYFRRRMAEIQTKE